MRQTNGAGFFVATDSSSTEGLLWATQSGSECGEELVGCCKLCVALLLCCNNYNRTLKTATASWFFSALCGRI